MLIKNLLQDTYKSPADFSVYDIIAQMRKQRPAMVQTEDQYRLVYRGVHKLFRMHLGLLDHAYSNHNAAGDVSAPLITYISVICDVHTSRLTYLSEP